MDVYLEMAVAVIRAERRPLGPRAILATAYRRGLVPARLYGKTQHKTLQARISEDIVAKRERSLFFRTAPGRIFLREFLTDKSLPEQFRRAIPTRRRIRELERGPALALRRDAIARIAANRATGSAEKILPLLRNCLFKYDDPKKRQNDSVFIRSFVCVFRNSEVLTYRLGRYRDDRETFTSRRSIGFSTLVHPEDHTLFDRGDRGIVESGVRAAQLDLDIPHVPDHGELPSSLACFVWVCDEADHGDLLAVVKFECPDWFEPTRRRLALNDLAWLDLRNRVNDMEDFDPWSKAVLLAYYSARRELNAEDRYPFAFP